MKFNFKKIASVLASTVMLSSTIALAAAANYPAPFVQGGNADVAIVYGSNAAVTDLVAVGDINTDLQAKLAAQTAVAGNGGSTTVSSSGGDLVQLDRPSSKLHLGSGVSDVFGRSVTNSDMPTLLADGVFTSDGDNKDHKYTQKIDVENLSLSQFDDNDYASDMPTLGVRIASGSSILNYTLTFNDKPDFNDNLKNSDITIMGKNYYVLAQSNSSTPSLTLLDSASTQTFNEGEAKSVTVGNATYDITVTDVTSDNKVKISVGGKTSNSLAIGATYKVADGVYIGVKDVTYKNQGYQGAPTSHADLSVGAGKLVLNDGSDIELNDESINNLVAHISNSSTSLNSLTIQWKADGDQFVTANNSIVMPGFGAVKLSLPGMVFPASEETNLVNNGKYTVQLNAPIKDGNAQIDLLSNNASTTNYTIIGKDGQNILRTASGSSVTFDADTDQNFVASWASGKDAESYLLYATSFRDDNGVNKTTIKERVGTFSQDVQNGDSIVLGNVVLTIGAIDKDGKSVVITGGSTVSFNKLYTADGLKIYLPYGVTTGSLANSNVVGGLNQTAGTSSFSLVATEEDKDGNIGAGNNVSLTLGLTSKSYVTINNVAFQGGGSDFNEIDSSNVFQGFAYSPLATEVSWDQGPDQETAKLIYHGAESYGQLVLTDVSTVVTGGSSGSSGGTVRSLGSVAVADSEVSSVSSNNLIVVGGSCVNTVAAKLLGSTTPLCGADWQQATGVGSGSFLVQTFTSPYAANKIATLVAGYNAPDTTNAAKALETQAVDSTVGKKYTGSVANSISLATTTA